MRRRASKIRGRRLPKSIGDSFLPSLRSRPAPHGVGPPRSRGERPSEDPSARGPPEGVPLEPVRRNSAAKGVLFRVQNRPATGLDSTQIETWRSVITPSRGVFGSTDPTRRPDIVGGNGPSGPRAARLPGVGSSDRGGGERGRDRRGAV